MHVCVHVNVHMCACYYLYKVYSTFWKTHSKLNWIKPAGKSVCSQSEKMLEECYISRESCPLLQKSNACINVLTPSDLPVSCSPLLWLIKILLMLPFAGSGDTAQHTAPTLGDDWIKKVSDPIIAFELHPMWACAINVMIIHITPMLPQEIFSHLVLIRWHVALIFKHRHNPLKWKIFQENIQIKCHWHPVCEVGDISATSGSFLVILLEYNVTVKPFYKLKVHIVNYTEATTCAADSHLSY